MVVRTRLLLAGATLLFALGCFYKFNNAVTKQSSGSIAGQLVLNDAAMGQTLTGATVTLEWSGLTVHVGPTDGKFLFVGLPAGTFTLRYDLPAKAGNLFPLIGFRHDLLLPGDPGAADAINLGPLPITPTGRVEGSVSGGTGLPIVLGAFTPLQPDGGGHDFEGFTTTTDSAGAFSFLLPAGNHDLACSTTSAVDAKPVTLNSQQVLTPFSMALAPAAETQSSVGGFLVFGDQGVNADATVVDPRLQFVTTTVVAEDGTIVATPVSLANQVPGAGVSFEQQLPPGHDYTVTFRLTAAQDPQSCSYFPPLVLPHIPGIAGQTMQLGQVVWLQSGVFIANGGPGVCSDDGGAGPSWQMLNAAGPASAFSVLEVVPLPIGDGDGGTKGHRLTFLQGDGLVYSTDDVASSGASYPPATPIWSDGTNPVFSITGTSTPPGGAAFGWVEANLSQATVAYYPPGAGSETPKISSFALPVPPASAPATMALVAGSDATGAPGLWVIIVEEYGSGGSIEFWFTSDFVNYARVLPIVPPDTDGGAGDAGPVDAGLIDAGPSVDAGPIDAGTGFDAGPLHAGLRVGHIVGTPCSLPELDGGQGVCFAATVDLTLKMGDAGDALYQWAYDGVLDTQQALPVLSVQLVVDAGSGESFGIPAITAAPLPDGGGLSTVTSGWLHASPALGSPEYQVATFTTLTQTPSWSPLQSTYLLADDGMLLQWQGAPLALAVFLDHNPIGVGNISLGTAMPPPFLAGFGVAQLLHGYNAPNGDLYIAAYDHPAAMTSQIGLFVWPPQL